MNSHPHKDHAWGVILAAGSGSRMGDSTLEVPKQFFPWKERPLFWHSALAFSRCACIDGLIFVFAEKFLHKAFAMLQELFTKDDPGLPWKLVKGGATRCQSSRNALLSLPRSVKKVLIHDAARPFVKPELIWRVCEAISCEYKGAVPALPVHDTIKIINPVGEILDTPARENLVAVQTPQGFDTQALRESFEKYENSSVTDDATLLEKAGFKIKIVTGMEDNRKITTREDLRLLKEESAMVPCAGFGYDVHRYGCGKPLKLGGVPINQPFEVIAHSDGDVLLHALIDAILGCAGLGDIGDHFPDSDDSLENISSSVLLEEVLKKTESAGLKISQADLTIVAQKPKLTPWKREIRKNISRLLQLPESRINLKATTEENLGFTGRCEGIKAYAMVTGQILEDKSPQ